MVYRVQGQRDDGRVVVQRRSAVLTIPRGEVTVDGATVWTSPFRIDRNLVRRSEYRAYAQATGRRAPPEETFDDDLPVVSVSFEEAAAFAAHFGGRIPSEAEWQLAASGFGDRTYPGATGTVFVENGGPTAWRSAYPARTPRAVGAGAPFFDSVFGVSDLGEVWELTSTAAPAGVVVRGGAWRDRTLPPRLDNRSTESRPAHDVGFRCAYPIEHTATAGRGYPGIPARRSQDESAWKRELLSTDDGLRAYLEQELARVGEPYAIEPVPVRFVPLRTLSNEDVVAWRRAHDEAVARMKTSHERRYRMGDHRYYDVYVDETELVVTHSRTTGGIDGPQQALVFGETSTRLGLEVFVALDYDASDFIGYVIATFEGNHDSPT